MPRRAAIVLSLVCTCATAALAQDSAATPQHPAYWPPEGRIGLAAMVQARSGGCRLSLIALNNTAQDLRDLRLTMVIAVQNGPGQVVDTTFRLLDAGGAREAPAWVTRRCGHNPVIEIREARCSTGPLAFRDCLDVVQPFTPPPQRARELARISVVAPR